MSVEKTEKQRRGHLFWGNATLFVGGGSLSRGDAIVLGAPPPLPPFKVCCMYKWDEGWGEDSSVDGGWGGGVLLKDS